LCILNLSFYRLSSILNFLVINTYLYTLQGKETLMTPKLFSNNFRIYFLWFLLSILSNAGFQFKIVAQTKIDSLENQMVFELPLNSNIDTLLNLAQSNFESNQDKAIFYAKIAYEQAVKESNENIILLTSRTLADAYYYKDEFANAIDFYRITADYEKNIYGEFSDEYGSRLGDIGYCFYLLGIYDVTNTYYQKALIISKSNKNQENIHTNINNLGTLYFAWGQYDKAIDAFVQTLEYDKEQNNYANLSASYNNIGKVYFILNKYKQAIQYYNQALEYSKKTKNNSTIAIRYGNLGMVYYKQGDYTKAQKFLNAAILLDKKQGNDYKVAIRQNELGKISEAQGNYTLALNYQVKALQTFKQLNIKESQAITYINIAEIYEHLNEFEKSEFNYNKAISITKEIGSVYNEMMVYEGISGLYKKTNQYKKSLNSYMKYDSLSKDIFSVENNRQLVAFQVKYNTEKKEKEIALLKKEAIIKDIRISKSRIIGVSLTAISLLLILVTYTYIKKNRLKKEVNTILGEKNKQLQVLNATKTKFFAIISHDLLNPIAAFHSLTKSMESSFDTIPKEKLHSFIKELSTSSEKVYLLLQNLLTWASINNGRMKYGPKNTDLANLLAEVVDVQKMHAQEKGIRLDLAVIDETIVFVDRLMIATVVRNLISNAIKFSPENTPVQTSVSDTEKMIQVSIKDYGIGMNKQDMDKLFKIEVDNKDIGSSTQKGTGLGLILCKELVEKCGGKIWVTSEVGSGSEFTFTVPKKNIKFEHE